MEIVDSVSLAFREEGSDKVYKVELRRTGIAGWSVWFAFGRRGKKLQEGFKIEATADEEEARKTFAALVRAKTAKGYRPEADASAPDPTPAPPPRLVAGVNALPPPAASLPVTAFGAGVMLAEATNWRDLSVELARLSESARFVGEVKLDGMRIIATIQEDRVESLLSRKGEVETHRFPEVVAALERMRLGTVVLDGEVGFVDVTGLKMDVNVLQHRPRTDAFGIRAHASAWPMTFVAFDILRVGAQDLRGLPYVTRRARLADLVQRGLVVVRCSREILSLYNDVVEAGGEGIIVKDTIAPYVGKRSSAWRKAKAPAYRDNLVIVGLTEGEGKRASWFGGFVLARETPAGLEFVCSAGSGLTDADLVRVSDAAPAYRAKACPIPKPPRLTKKVLMWLEPKMTADIKYEESVKAGPRFPRVLKVVIPHEEARAS